MQHRSRRFVPTPGSVGLVLTLVLLAGGAHAQTPDFSGTWVRDEEASEDPLAQVEEEIQYGPGGSPSGVSRGTLGRRGRGAGRPPRGRRGQTGDRAGEELAAARRHLEGLVAGLEALRIVHRGASFEIRNSNRETSRLLTDGRPVGDGFGSRTFTTIEDGVVVIDTRTDQARLLQQLELEPDGSRLYMLTDLQGRGVEAVRFRTVYDRVGGPPARTTDGGPEAAPGDLPAREPVVAPLEPAPGSPGASAAPSAAGGDRRPGSSPRAIALRDDEPVTGSIIRILPLPYGGGERRGGKVQIETLSIDPSVLAVEFLVDGVSVERRTIPPFDARVALADPPREQIVRVDAYGVGGRLLGHDQIVVNRLDPPFRVHIAAIERADDVVTVSAEVSVPRKASLETVRVFHGDRQIAESTEAPFVASLAAADVEPTDFVRVVARLADGREREDVQLLQPGAYAEEVDVHLVQLQVLVTDPAGVPVPGLVAEDFEIVEGGQRRQIERLYPSRDLALVLGLAIDSSGSMYTLWPQTRAAADTFLGGTLGPRDRAFLVDFDSRLRLLQPLTSDKDALSWAMERLQPRGGTALYDSILFSLLQFAGEPGRRALIVLTDGYDSESRADPRRAIDLGERLGVPVYVIGISPGGARGGPGAASLDAVARSELRLLTDPTGGRMFHVVTAEQIAAAFARIQDELRRQYVLTYYSDLPAGEQVRPTIEMRRKGLRVRAAIPLDQAD